VIAGREAAQGSFKQNTPKCDLMAWDRKRQFDRDAYFRDNPDRLLFDQQRHG